MTEQAVQQPSEADMERFRELQAMTEEPLHPDLAEYLVPITEVEDWVGLDKLFHPLVVQVPLVTPGYCNRQYEQQKRRLAEYEAKEDYKGMLWVYERPYRLAKLIEWWWEGQLPPDALTAKIVGDAWRDMEGDDRPAHSEVAANILEIMADLGYFADEQAPQDAPTEPLTVYRGGDDEGIAWSVDIDIARWFAKRFRPHKPVYQATAPPEAVRAMLFGRNESEVVCDPEMLEDITEIEGPAP